LAKKMTEGSGGFSRKRKGHGGGPRGGRRRLNVYGGMARGVMWRGGPEVFQRREGGIGGGGGVALGKK